MKLFVSDLDFTLLGLDGTLSERACRGLNTLIADGLNFTVATARSEPSIRHLLRGVTLSLPVIELNGAILRDLQTGHILDHNGLGMKTARRVHDIFLELGYAPFVSGLIGDRNPLYVPALNNAGMQWFFDEKIHYRDPRLTESPGDLMTGDTDLEDVLCFVYLGAETEIKRIAVAVAAKAPDALVVTYANHYTGGWEIVVSAAKANKGHAVGRLLAHLREQRELAVSETIAFGDSSNDLEMLDAVDRPVAVGNAITDVKARATEIIGPHTEDAVVSYLERQFMAGRTDVP